jgi:hypothetical protein
MLQVGAIPYAAIMKMIRRKLEANPALSVSADEIGISIRLNDMLSRIGLRASSVVIAFPIVSITS